MLQILHAVLPVSLPVSYPYSLIAISAVPAYEIQCMACVFVLQTGVGIPSVRATKAPYACLYFAIGFAQVLK